MVAVYKELPKKGLVVSGTRKDVWDAFDSVSREWEDNDEYYCVYLPLKNGRRVRVFNTARNTIHEVHSIMSTWDDQSKYSIRIPLIIEGWTPRQPSGILDAAADHAAGDPPPATVCPLQCNVYAEEEWR